MRVSNVLLSIAAMSLAGCIPRGGEDYRIQSPAGAPVAEPLPPSGTPVTVPEKEVIAPTPSWNPAVVQQNARLSAAGTYIVKRGDTLFGVGRDTGAGATAIARANGLEPPYALSPGQKLIIPGGTYHRVSAGETGIAISRAYGVVWNDVVTLNQLQAPYTLTVGQYLLLPDKASPLPPSGEMSAEQRAAAFNLDIDAIVTGSNPAPPQPGKSPPANMGKPVAVPASFGGSFGWPLSGAIASRFGSKGGGKVNDGLDIAAALGTPVGAAGDGVVVYSGNEISVYGGLVLIDHGDGWITAYGHMGTLGVRRGDKVKRGHRLGSVGDTGYVDRPLLHFEIRKNRLPIDPLTQLPAR